MFNRALILAFLVSSSAFAAPEIGHVLPVIRRSENFEYTDGALRLRPNKAQLYNKIGANEFTAKDKNHRIAITQETEAEDRIWRLTESAYSEDLGLYKSQSVTFFNDGPRSKTTCFGVMDVAKKKDNPTNKMSCTTATRKYCGGLLKFIKSKDGAKLLKDQKSIEQMAGGAENLVFMCQQYSAYLAKMSEASVRGLDLDTDVTNYNRVAKADTDAAYASLKAMRGWSFTQSVLSGPSVQGKGIDDGAARANALENFSADSLATAALIENCQSTEFAQSVTAGTPAKSGTERPAQ